MKRFSKIIKKCGFIFSFKRLKKAILLVILFSLLGFGVNLVYKFNSSESGLKLIYEKEESIIRNLLTFKNASYQKVYEDAKDFADTYPFIPYQFKLL